MPTVISRNMHRVHALLCFVVVWQHSVNFNTLRPRKNRRHLANDIFKIFKCVFLMKIVVFWWKFHWTVFLRFHDDVIKLKHFPRYWHFVRGIHRSLVNCLHKGQWRGALMFSLICAWINRWVNNREAGDLRRHRAHYHVIVMSQQASTGSDNGLAWNKRQAIIWINDDLVYRGYSYSMSQMQYCRISIKKEGAIWPSWHLKSPKNWLFIQQLVPINSRENTKAPHYWIFARGIYARRSPNTKDQLYVKRVMMWSWAKLYVTNMNLTRKVSAIVVIATVPVGIQTNMPTKISPCIWNMSTVLAMQVV